MGNDLENSVDNVCPYLSNHCKKRIILGLSEEQCRDDSYLDCPTYQVLKLRSGGKLSGPYMPKKI